MVQSFKSFGCRKFYTSSKIFPFTFPYKIRREEDFVVFTADRIKDFGKVYPNTCGLSAKLIKVIYLSGQNTSV